MEKEESIIISGHWEAQSSPTEPEMSVPQASQAGVVGRTPNKPYYYTQPYIFTGEASQKASPRDVMPPVEKQ